MGRSSIILIPFVIAHAQNHQQGRKGRELQLDLREKRHRHELIKKTPASQKKTQELKYASNAAAANEGGEKVR